MRQTAWRLVKTRHAATAFNGEGASIAGGRWNSQGVQVVYTSAFKSLAVLETLVHLNPQISLSYVIFQVGFEETMIEKLAERPREWQEMPAPRSVQGIGDLWVREGRSAVLEVPSTILPSESNFLINPNHPDFKKVVIGKPEPFAFDPRLL